MLSSTGCPLPVNLPSLIFHFKHWEDPRIFLYPHFFLFSFHPFLSNLIQSQTLNSFSPNLFLEFHVLIPYCAPNIHTLMCNNHLWPIWLQGCQCFHWSSNLLLSATPILAFPISPIQVLKPKASLLNLSLSYIH